ncbi:MAG: hypothetical protein Ct9H300mP25_01540 [Acidobacteriota bacterium]|nr:MAG: hypothetical protein Ct9H300mP25_01540 [Acidobacteriota bacterium]
MRLANGTRLVVPSKLSIRLGFDLEPFLGIDDSLRLHRKDNLVFRMAHWSLRQWEDY